MKKMMLVLMAMVMLASACCAEETKVFVSISNSVGDLVMAYEEIAVTDVDNDGAVTIHDALACAHAVCYENGNEGYMAEKTEYGLSLVRLWGEDNGGSFGYYLNHASAWSLLDAVKEGDHVKAYAFTDLEMWSDTYCYFDSDAIEMQPNTEVQIVLSAASFDEAWNPVVLPVSGAVVTVNGEATAWKTGDDGSLTMAFDEGGVYVISAVSDTQTLVAPVCIVTVKEIEQN